MYYTTPIPLKYLISISLRGIYIDNLRKFTLAAATFFMKHIQVGELGQAQHLLEPILGKNAAIVFGIALLFSGISSTTTAGMAGGSIIAGMFKVMRQYKNSLADKTVLWMIGIIVSVLNIMLLASYIYVLIYENRSLNISIKQEIPT